MPNAKRAPAISKGVGPAERIEKKLSPHRSSELQKTGSTRQKTQSISACKSYPNYEGFMKRYTIISLAAVVVLAGCVVTSVSPFYTQADLVYEPSLAGNWMQAKGGSEVWRFEQSDAK